MDFVSKYKKDLIYSGILLIILALCATFTINLFGDILTDSGTEAYYPELIAKGKVLYKDLFYIYSPLALQINATLYSIFGFKLEVLRGAAFFSAAAIFLCLYGISRTFFSPEKSFFILLPLMFFCCFESHLCSYLFPYVFAIQYSFLFFLISVFSLLHYLKGKNSFIYLTYFFAGASFATKYEYIPYFVVLACLPFIYKFSKKTITYCIISFLSIPFLSYAALFLSGLRLENLIETLGYLKDYINSDGLKYFYTHRIGTFPYLPVMFEKCWIFFTEVVFILFIFTPIYYLLKSSLKNISKVLLFVVVAILTVTQNFIVLYLLTMMYFVAESSEKKRLVFYTVLFFINLFAFNGVYFGIFYFFPILALILFVNQLIKREIDVKTAFLLIAITSSFKVFFGADLISEGTYSLPLLYIAFFVYVPYKFKKVTLAIILTLLIYSALDFVLNPMFKPNRYYVQTEKGKVYSYVDGRGEVLESFFDWIKNVEANKTVWILPEGSMFNFLTSHPSLDYYYALTPQYVQGFGEDKIINDLKKNPVDYIVISNMSTAVAGKKAFCTDYALELCEFIQSNYIEDKVFSNGKNKNKISRWHEKDFMIKVYRKGSDK